MHIFNYECVHMHAFVTMFSYVFRFVQVFMNVCESLCAWVCESFFASVCYYLYGFWSLVCIHMCVTVSISLCIFKCSWPYIV